MPGLVEVREQQEQDHDAPPAKRQKLTLTKPPQHLHRPRSKPRIFAPFRTVGLVSPTPIPFASIAQGKTTFHLTTSAGRCLQTYNLVKGLNLVFLTRPDTPGPITATATWTDKVLAAWSTQDAQNERGTWIFKRGKRVGQLRMPRDQTEDIVQILVLGLWIVGCGVTKIDIWSSSTYEHHATLLPPFVGPGTGDAILTGGICSVPTFTNKILAGRDDGSVEIWNVNTCKLKYRILPSSADAGPVSALQPAPALGLAAIAYGHGLLVIHDIQTDEEVIRMSAAQSIHTPVTSISFRTDGFGAGPDGSKPGVMATASFASGDVTFWDLNNGSKKTGTLRGAHNGSSLDQAGNPCGISKIEFLHGQAVIVTCGNDNSLKSWIFDDSAFSPTPRILHVRSGHAGPLTTLNFLPTDFDGAEAGGKWLLSTSQDRSFWGWSLRRDGQSSELSQGHIQKKSKKLGLLNSSTDNQSNDASSLKAPEITCIACSLNRDGGIGAMPGVKDIWTEAAQRLGKSTATEQNITGWESVVTGHKDDKFARTWFWGRKRAGRWIFKTTDQGTVNSVAISPCGTFALIGSSNGAIDRFNLQSGFHRQHYPASFSDAQRKKLEASNPQLAKYLALPKAQSRKLLNVGKHTKAVTGLEVESLNRVLVSSSEDGTIKFWDFQTGHLLQHLSLVRSPHTLTGMTHHRPSGLLAISSTDSTVRILDITTRSLVRELHLLALPNNSSPHITDAAFTPTARHLITSTSDNLIQTFDVSTGHLIDAMILPATCKALTFSNTGEYLATTLEGSVGIHVWTNRMMFRHVPLRPINGIEDVAVVGGPSASGEAGETIVGAAIEGGESAEEAAEADDELQEELQLDSDPSIEQLNSNLTTTSLVPKSHWQTLMHLDTIKERNKPDQPPKAPEKAPFFLQSLLTSDKDAASQTQSPKQDESAESSRITRLSNLEGRNQDTFSTLLKACIDVSLTTVATALSHPANDPLTEAQSALTTHLATLTPAAADLAIRTLNPAPPYDGLIAFVSALTSLMKSKRSFELVQAWMRVFLNVHGEVVGEAVNASMDIEAGGEVVDGATRLVEAVRTWRSVQKEEVERLSGLTGYCVGVLGFLRDTSR